MKTEDKWLVSAIGSIGLCTAIIFLGILPRDEAMASNPEFPERGPEKILFYFEHGTTQDKLMYSGFLVSSVLGLASLVGASKDLIQLK